MGGVRLGVAVGGFRKSFAPSRLLLLFPPSPGSSDPAPIGCPTSRPGVPGGAAFFIFKVIRRFGKEKEKLSTTKKRE